MPNKSSRKTTKKKVTRKKKLSLQKLRDEAYDNALGRGVRRNREWDREEIETLEEMIDWVREGDTTIRALTLLIRSKIQAGHTIEGIGPDRTHSAINAKLKELSKGVKKK